MSQPCATLGSVSDALLLENPHRDADPLLARAGLDVARYPGALVEDALIEALDGVRVLGIRSATRVTARVLDNAPNLEAIGAFCIGTTQIDLQAAARRGIAVFNAPYSNTRSVVELAIGEIIALLRRMTERDRSLHAGLWEKSASGAHEVRGRTLGIVGYGNIGAQLSVLAEALGMRVIFFDIADKLALGNAQRCSTISELLREADIVSLHVDDRPANRGLFGAPEFGLMKPGSIFLNLSRGFVVDNNALRGAILDGQLSGAALDVFPEEPHSNGEEFVSALRGLPNVILTPHIGGSTLEAQEAIGQFVGGKLGGYVTSANTDLSVTLPSLTLPPNESATQRVAYVHRNTPGVMALVNQAFAEAGANVSGQILGTRGEIGYMISDLSNQLPVEIVEALRGMEDTIRLRVL